MKLLEVLRRRLEWSMQAGRFRFFYDDPSLRLIIWARWAEREYGKDTRLSRQAILYGLRHLFSGGITWTPNRRRKEPVGRKLMARSSRTGRTDL